MLFAFFEKEKERGRWSSSRHFYVFFSLKLVLLAVSNLCPFIDSLVTLTTGLPDMYPCSSSIRIREREISCLTVELYTRRLIILLAKRERERNKPK